MMVRELFGLPKKVESSFSWATQGKTLNMLMFLALIRQTKRMLPRKKYQGTFAIAGACLLVGVFLGQPASQAYVRVPPKVTINNFLPQHQVPIKNGDGFVFQILNKAAAPPFSLVGITWLGNLPAGTVFRAKVHDKSGWSHWQELSYSFEHGPDSKSEEARAARNGTDPLITARSDGIQLQALTAVAKLPKNLKVSLIDSATSPTDVSTFRSARSSVGTKQNLGAVITKAGAIIDRPNIVTRAQWGADESWRDPSPRISNKIIAGFIHHTATTNSYSPENGPAQMRSLYAYFTKSLKYADMGYNFLVDRYGVVYEGRAGCGRSAGSSCDGPSRAVIGAHTAGMNDNTFAISAIGNFQTGSIDEATAKLLTKSISELMTWKIAPYNLDPSAMARIPSTDTSGLSKYRNGTVATVPVISGHRDVGRTVCPGKYLYAFVPQIRSEITALLVGHIQNVSVLPIEQLADDTSPVSITAEVPVTSSWNVAVVEAESGSVVYAQSGTQQSSNNFVHNWEHTDTTGQLLPAGNYAVSLSATVGDRQLPTETTMITLGRKPARMTGFKMNRVSNAAVVVSWPVQPDSVPLVDAIEYRTSTTKGRTWSIWKQLPESTTQKTFTSALAKRRILIEFKQTNAMGESLPVRMSFVAKSR